MLRASVRYNGGAIRLPRFIWAMALAAALCVAAQAAWAKSRSPVTSAITLLSESAGSVTLRVNASHATEAATLCVSVTTEGGARITSGETDLCGRSPLEATIDATMPAGSSVRARAYMEGSPGIGAVTVFQMPEAKSSREPESKAAAPAPRLDSRGRPVSEHRLR